MLKFIKNILLISYLKNKGIRRICFIIGLILAIIPLISWYNDLNNYFYNEKAFFSDAFVLVFPPVFQHAAKL